MSERVKKLFCTSQRLSLLLERDNVRPFLSGERFWRDRHANRPGKKKSKSPWRGIKRSALVRNLCAAGRVKRLAVVCSAGWGKSANLEWLEYKIAQSDPRQVPFRFELDDEDLPSNLHQFWNETLSEKIRQAPGNGDITSERLKTALLRLRAQGRITLLFDAIDQASQNGLALLRKLLKTADWDKCPIIVSSRPEGLYHRWPRIIVPNERSWRFVRVEPLAPRQRKLLLEQDGKARYRALPPGGRALMANPRHIEYVRKLPLTVRSRRRSEPQDLHQYELGDLQTAPHVFAGAAHHMVSEGMNNPRARLLGLPKDKPPPRRATPRQIDFALDLLGALAYTMYTMPAPGSSPGESFRPNVSHVPAHGRRREAFDNHVVECLRSCLRGYSNYTIADLEQELEALAALNSYIDCSLLDTESFGAIRWHDRSLQEFFAAWWLSRFADAKDLQRLRQWRYDDTRDQERKSLYEPLWGFLVEMPRAVRRIKRWVPAVGVLYEHQCTRCCEMIFRSWPSLWKSLAGCKVIDNWRSEFRQYRTASGPDGDTARQIRSGFRRCPRNSAADDRPFLMGSPEAEENRDTDELQHQVTVSPFALHEFPVTNAQFKLFDPARERERWDWPFSNLHPAGEAAKDHPAVSVTWFQAWCFAQWTGHRLPTEAEWEYACRAGTTTDYSFGRSIKKSLCNLDSELDTTTAKGTYPPNSWLLYDMHGNVYEWCWDWYSARYYERGREKNPQGPRSASKRVLRGGSWDGYRSGCRSAYRYWSPPGHRYHLLIGFRLAAVPAVGAEPGEQGKAQAT